MNPIILILVLAACTKVTHPYDRAKHQFKVIFQIGNLQYDVNSKELKISWRDKAGLYHQKLTGILGLNLAERHLIKWRQMQDDFILKPLMGLAVKEKLSISFDNDVVLTVVYSEGPGNIQCYDTAWTSSASVEPLDCVDTGTSRWYGGAEMNIQQWPINKAHVSMQEYISSDIGTYLTKYGSVLEPYWINSQGSAMAADENVPLFVSINATKLCMKASYQHSHYSPASDTLSLHYAACLADNIKTVHKFASGALFQKPQDIPDVAIFKYPIWSTWARYHSSINQSEVTNFAHEIKMHGFAGCQIEIDDRYTTTYGDYVFDKTKFPDPSNMTKAIHDLGFRVTSWVMPFANPDSQAFQEGVQERYWVRNSTGDTAIVSWWNGKGALLDVTNPAAVTWYLSRLKSLEKLGINSFKFDAGETGFLPKGFITYESLHNPNRYSTLYANMVSANATKFAEVRVGHKSQRLPLFVRILDRESDWGYARGLRSIIPTVLQFGIVGYPFVLPDMIGGNGYLVSLPNKELYIRWLQLNAFLPTMQFSFTPWDYDDHTVAIATKFVKLHITYVTPLMLTWAKKARNTGDPMIRPLWFYDPTDNNTIIYDDDSTFFIGDQVIVAPILDQGATQRDIYLPKGKWQDMLHGNVINGPKLLKSYHIPLEDIAYFERKKEGINSINQL